MVALDLGERVFSGALVNLVASFARFVESPVDGRNGDDALLVLYRLIDDLAPARGSTILGIGVGTPGLVDSETGTIRWAVNLDWQDLPLGSMLHDRYECRSSSPTTLTPPPLGEWTFSTREGRVRQPHRRSRSDDGIGAGIVLRGQLFQGDGHGAGEIGHVVLGRIGVACRCGRCGCLETVAGAPAILLARPQRPASRHFLPWKPLVAAPAAGSSWRTSRPRSTRATSAPAGSSTAPAEPSVRSSAA